MRRVTALLLILLGAVTFAVAYLDADESQRSSMQHAALQVAAPFSIPGDSRLADPEVLYPALLDAARQAHVNVIRTSIGYTAQDTATVTHYLLLTRGTDFFRAFTLDSGRMMTPAETVAGSAYQSTAAALHPGTGGERLVGLLADFGGDDRVQIRPLRRAYDALPVAGTYAVEAANPAARDHFLRVLTQALDKQAGAPVAFSAADFAGSQASFTGIVPAGAKVATAVQYVLIALITLLLAYSLLHDAKHAGVMKLNGFGTIRVWYHLCGRLILLVLLTCAGLSVIGALLVPDAPARFVLTVLGTLGGAAALMLACSLLTSVYIAGIRLSDSVKNRKDTQGIFVVNTGVKFVCTVALIVVGSGLWLQYAAVATERDRLGNWAKTDQYGIFYPTSVGADLVDTQTGQPGGTVAEAYALYPALSKAGAIFIDSTSYEPQALAQPLQPGAIRSMKVNPNYLRTYPVRDTAGKVVEVADDERDWVVLAPQQLQSRRADLLRYFQQSRADSYGAEKAVLGSDPPAAGATQHVKLIWLARDQHVFSFNPAVDSAAGNEIVDPVIQVMTMSNSLGVDRANAVTGGADTALKVRLSNGDAPATLAALRPTLRRLKLDDNLTHLITMNEYVLTRIHELQVGVRNLQITAVALAVGLLVLIIEGLGVVFYRYSRRVVVRRLFGLGFRRSYREFLTLFAVIWMLQVLAAVFADQSGASPFSTATFSAIAGVPVVVGISLVVLAAELVCTIAVLTFIDKRSATRVLKGEF